MQTAHILLIEDDALISQAYKIGLENVGMQVDIAVDGNEGLKAMQEGTYDLILLDIILPKMDGFQLLEQVQNVLSKKKIPVIILSNLGQDTDIERGKSLGAVDFLVKANNSMDAVLEKVRSHLSHA